MEKQEFQSRIRLLALRVHAGLLQVARLVSAPVRSLIEELDGTSYFRKYQARFSSEKNKDS